MYKLVVLICTKLHYSTTKLQLCIIKGIILKVIQLLMLSSAADLKLHPERELPLPESARVEDKEATSFDVLARACGCWWDVRLQRP